MGPRTFSCLLGHNIRTFSSLTLVVFFNAQYTMARMFLLPGAYYIAIALASLALVFPESVNHLWLSVTMALYTRTVH